MRESVAGAPNRVNVAPGPTLSLGCPSHLIPVHGRIHEGFGILTYDTHEDVIQEARLGAKAFIP